MRQRLIILAPDNQMEFSGTPNALARALAGVADSPFDLVHSLLHSPVRFRFPQLLYAARRASWNAKNGFGLSSDYMSAAWARSGTRLRQGDTVIICHPVVPRQVVAAARSGQIRFVTYVDMALDSYFRDYDLRGRIPARTRALINAEEAEALAEAWCIFTLDAEGADSFREGHHHLDPARIIPIGRGANIQLDQLDIIRRMRQVRGKGAGLNVLFIGKDAARKGLYEAISGIEALPPELRKKVVLHAVGPDRSDVPDLPFIRRHGLLDRDKTPDLYAELLSQADVGLLLTRAEGNPGSVAEFLACGVPAIVSDLPRLTEIFAGTAVTFLPQNDMAASFTRLLTSVMDDPAILARLTGLAQRDQDRFTWSPVAKRLLQHLRAEPATA